VAATHRDLRAEVKAGRFREDLLFRISTFVLTVPPLRDRPGEIALLAAEFAARLGPRHGLARVEILPATFAALRARAWPGNVRIGSR
jgi:two-component system response regulator HupR/HoxA